MYWSGTSFLTHTLITRLNPNSSAPPSLPALSVYRLTRRSSPNEREFEFVFYRRVSSSFSLRLGPIRPFVPVRSALVSLVTSLEQAGKKKIQTLPSAS